MSKIQHIVFDVGLVLLHWNPELVYLDRIPDPDSRRDFLDNVCSPQWNIEQDRGRSWTEAEALLIDEHPHHEDNIRAFRSHWIKSVPYAYLDVVDIYQNMIDKGYDVTLLTNFNQDTFVEVQAKYPFLDRARSRTVSGLVQLLKPDPEIYQHHTQAHDLDPEHTVFIDDSEKNASGARQSGWQAIQFAGREGAAKLHAALQDVGVKF